MARRKLKREHKAPLVQSQIEDLLDEGLEETFPASDSVAVDWIEKKMETVRNNADPKHGKASRKRNVDAI